jgi:hypothetical protein
LDTVLMNWRYMIDTAASYSACPRFRSRYEDRLSWKGCRGFPQCL